MPPATSEQGAFNRPRNKPTSREMRRPLRLALPADPMTPSVARQRVREWLTAWSWPTDHIDDIVFVVSEAVSNAVEHAYVHQPLGMVEIHGGIETTPRAQHRAAIIVRDHGHWRAPPPDNHNRGRGIPLMQAMMDTVTIGQPPDNGVGTWVVLRSPAVLLASPNW